MALGFTYAARSIFSGLLDKKNETCKTEFTTWTFNEMIIESLKTLEIEGTN